MTRNIWSKITFANGSLNLGGIALLLLSACSDDAPPTEPPASGGSAGTSGGPSAGSGGAVSGGTGMTAGTGGTGGPAGGTAGNAGASGSMSAGAGGEPAAGRGGGNAGGAGAGGSGGTGGGGGTGTGCTRELLKSSVQAYFQALAAHDPVALQLSASVKFTENGQASELGKTALWKSAGMVKYSHSALDTETCSSATHAVVPDGAMDIPFALRLKLQDQKISEVETIAVRPGDYKVGGQNFPSNTGAISASADTVRWEEVVPAGERNSRKEITDWMNKYFRMFPRGVCNVTSTCKRLENGGGSFDCSAGASCASGQPGAGDAELDPRLILADVETGIGVGFTMFQGHTDMHLFKMRGGQVHGVHAILGAAGSPGWD